MIDYYQALAQLQEALAPHGELERVPLSAAAGRVLAAPVAAVTAMPQFDNSAMDGYALADPAATLTRFRLCGRTGAGDQVAGPLSLGEAQKILTGAPVPQGTTAVVPQEQVTLEQDQLRLDSPTPVGSNLRYQGEEYAAGAELLRPGQRLNAPGLALAASQGHASLTVYRRLRVWLFSSGNELQEPGQPLASSQIYDANRYQLLAGLAGLPLELHDGGILPDDAEQIRLHLADAASQADVIITSGGASVGDADYLKQAVQALGTLDAWKLAIKPGKPFAWGRIDRCRVFMLPGNPVATFVTGYLLLLPALKQMMGFANMVPASLPVRSGFSWRADTRRREFLRAVLVPAADGGVEVKPLAGQGSAMLRSCVEASMLVEIPANTEIAPGDWLKAYPCLPSA